MIIKYKGFNLLLILIIMFSLTIGYSFLNLTININGRSTISKNTWDVHFENIKIKDGSVDASVEPIVSNYTTISNFKLTLSKPGDFYEFYVDVSNDGSIDAMIENIVKEPDLSLEQTKYLRYIVEYENGEQISSNQLLRSNEISRIKVRVEYKKDIDASDLPTVSETLNLGFTVNYVQSNNNGIYVDNNGKITYRIVSGDGTNIGDEICISDECFYVISKDTNKTVLFAKYNLHVGNEYNVSDDIVTPLSNPKGRQDPTAIGYFRGNSATNPLIGTVPFSSIPYWNSMSTYPIDIYDENSNLYKYIEDYKVYLNKLGGNVENARLISYAELEELGCNFAGNNCLSTYSWIYATTYWTSTAGDNEKVWNVISNGYTYADLYNCNRRGIRVVIEVPNLEI